VSGRRRRYSLKVKRGTAFVHAVVALFSAALLFAGSGCRERKEMASPAGEPPDHSKKSPLSPASLPFAPLSFDEALAKARAEKRLVFVDVYADWCTWCTKMDEDVFTDARVKTALLAYVPIKVDVDRGGGHGLASRYGVEGLPAFLLVNGNGELVGRLDGYFPAGEFLQRLGRFSGPRG
jgi:thiol:disulfide interchange protein